MKRKNLTLAFIFFFLFSANILAQNFWIPDLYFRGYLYTKHPTCFTPQDSLITNCPDLQNDTSLILNYIYFLSNVDGIQFLPNLEVFAVANCPNFSTIPSLPNKIRVIGIGNALGVHALPPLPDSLRTLQCIGTQVQSINFIPPKLEVLNLMYSPVSSVPALPNCLREFNCDHCGLTSLPPVLPDSLRILNCSTGFITSLPPLGSFLKELNCSYTSVTSFPTLPNSLEKLVVSGLNINSFPPLPPNLKSLNCAYTNMTTLPSLPAGLTELYCYHTLLKVLSPLPLNLRYLVCDHANLTNLPNLPDSLTDLNCSSNHISMLPTLPPKLNSLSCSENPLAFLPPLPQFLTQLYCYDAPLSCLPHLPDSLNYIDYHNTFIGCFPNYPSNLYLTGNMCIPQNPSLCSSGAPTCSNNYISCAIFLDANSNGTKDAGELALKLPIGFGNNYYTSTKAVNFITVISDTGNATFNVIVPQYYLATTPSSQTIHVSSNIPDTLYFGVYPIPNIQDLEVDLVAYNAIRPGFQVNYKIHYRNSGTITLPNVEVKFIKPSLFTNFHSTPSASALSGDTISWNIGSLSLNKEGYITLKCTVSPLAVLGSYVVAEAIIQPLPGDTTPFNNYSSTRDIVRGSCDPNDKSVNPEFVSPNQNDFFEYVIRFQNTGTDTAFIVLVTDTLSSLLDVATIQMLSSSHTANFWVENGIAKWYFTTILLPDSNVNEANSHGFVKFRIKSKANLQIGTQIPNAANIYFDYNAAVITNTIIVNVTPLSVPEIVDEKVKLYPNPVHQTVHLNNSNGTPLGKTQLINSEGKIIETRTISTSYFDWQVAQLPEGFYLFKGENWMQKIVKK